MAAEYSILIGGKAGDGINQAGLLIGRLIARLGYRLYISYDYPSLIRGGHNFSVVRAAQSEIGACRRGLSYLLALDQESIDGHRDRLEDPTRIIFDSGAASADGLGLPLAAIVKEESARDIMRNSCLVGAFAKSAGIEWSVLEEVLRKEIPRDLDANLRLARRGFERAELRERIEPRPGAILPLLTGNEACALGLIAGGLDSYIAYPMTPSSGLLHFLAQVAPDYGITVVHPENEIAVMLMALGFAYAGRRAAVGTSGGGFCLMTEGFSLAGMAEIPVVVMVGQRPGPSTGLPTYTSQTEMQFVMNAGQGEFPRLVVSPGDARDAYRWAAAALNLSWRFQIPSVILMDKTVCEGAYSFDPAAVEEAAEESALEWDGRGEYRRYQKTESGVSPVAFPPDSRAVVKANSYEHDDFGITTEDPRITAEMQEKRLLKGERLRDEMRRHPCAGVYGPPDSSSAILCWGSNRGVCTEAAARFGARVVHLSLLSPFPAERLRELLAGAKRLICVENNATGQLARLAGCHGIRIDATILKYDGRQFLVEELERELERVI